MDKKWVKLNMTIGILAVVVITVAGIFLVASNTFNYKHKYPVKNLDNGWTINYNGATEDTHRLSDIKVTSPEFGDVYSLEHELEGEDIPNASIFFRPFQSMVRAYFDGELIYEQGTEAFQKKWMPGRTICFIPLPSNYVGKKIEITITACEKGAFTSVGPLLMGNQQDLMHDFLGGRQLPHLFGTFLTLFAFFQFLMIPYLIMRNSRMMKQFFGALLVLTAGTYMLAFYNIFNIYISEPEVNTFLEFLSIYGIPTSMAGYLQYELKGRAGRIYTIFTIIDFMLLGAVLVLHFTNIIHISQSLMPMYVLCVIEIFPFVQYIIRMRKENVDRIRGDKIDEITAVIPLIGMGIFVAGSFIDMGYFLYLKNIVKNEADATIILTMAGGMLLALSQMLSFLLQGVSFLRSETNKRELLRVSRVDPLTGLSNRERFDQEIKDRRESDSNYAVIGVMLRWVGDESQEAEASQGKTAKRLAELLRSEFPDSAIISRISEEEYMIILDDISDREVRSLIDGFNSKVSGQKFEGCEVSCGSATSKEVRDNEGAYEVYLKAEERMYGMDREVAIDEE